MITLKHVAPKDLPLGSPTSAMVFQALHHLGKDSVGDETLHRIRHRLTPQERTRLMKDAHHITDWIAETARRIATEPSPEVARG